MRKGDAKKQAILDAAQRLFFQKGFEQTSVQDILSVLKCSKGSFYHHFESKLSVLETLCIHRAQEAADQAEKALQQEGEPGSRLDRLAYYMMPLRRGEERFMSLLLPLSAAPEGISLNYQYALALSEVFAPLWEREIAAAMAAQVCFPVKRQGMSRVILPLLNQCWQETARQVMSRRGQEEPLEAGDLLPVLDLYRSSLERLLDTPFGGMEIISLDELCQVCTQVLNRLRLEG